ncbi:protein tyrosine phosphatase [Oscillochloris sp. ZM17-4]|uniref:arsenate reductase/protein-tyrosine-phosphatase family protein n=1 Tax=Oscillochloris sp. ZM17-4 TaxID=2866714 RepID=UPI001C73A2F2|nr:protein tyrosine phosphatase [Oscillochloris sp. ZM17-4]MBX0328602.1 protein tyrosine phosphatase [Oscillochloris sp. ZM17-4]
MDTPPTPRGSSERLFVTLLADPQIWAVVQALSQGDAHAADLQIQTGTTLPALTSALGQLREAGLITSRASDADPQMRYYQLRVDQLYTLAQTSLGALHPALALAPPSDVWSAPSLPDRLRVLFLCTHNSARSQIAEGLLRMFSGGAIDAASAGVAPSRLHPQAHAALERVGADTAPLYSKHVDIFAGQHFDYVITVCDQAREVCPTFHNADRQLHWSLPDPSAAEEPRQPKAFQSVAIELAQRIRYLLSFIERDRRQAGAGATA